MKMTDEMAVYRTVTRELHEAIQEAKQVRRELQQLFDAIGPTIDRRISEEVGAGLERYQNSLHDAIAKAEKTIFHRFDTLVDTLLGEDWKKRKKREPTLQEQLLDRDAPMTAFERTRLEAWRQAEQHPEDFKVGTDILASPEAKRGTKE